MTPHSAQARASTRPEALKRNISTAGQKEDRPANGCGLGRQSLRLRLTPAP